ncbi:phosphotransferase [Bacteroides sp.]|mgnify:FL=1|uniref:phosphotransferase n=1 Tax=Bacteroides sp. TaxID=29523 RepID=UPI002A81DFB7|nr:phosphotransferase [Bacteroides sp.]
MEIEVKGHSGCSIDIVREGKELFIRKGTRDPKYVERLYSQALKQQKAGEQEYQFIRIPQIMCIEKSAQQMVMKMEYVYSHNFVDHFEAAGFEQVSYFVKAVRLFLKREIDQSVVMNVPRTLILDKFEDVNSKVCGNAMICNDEEVKQLMWQSAACFEALPEVLEIPVGCCHGDLTFSNILFNGNNYYLIDFLDSFIESPLLDMVKLRQDTCYRWSTLMYEGDFDETRFHIVADAIDHQLDEHFCRYTWYRDFYHPLQLMNFLRILQYVKEEKVANYLKKTIHSILNHE